MAKKYSKKPTTITKTSADVQIEAAKKQQAARKAVQASKDATAAANKLVQAATRAAAPTETKTSIDDKDK